MTFVVTDNCIKCKYMDGRAKSGQLHGHAAKQSSVPGY